MLDPRIQLNDLLHIPWFRRCEDWRCLLPLATSSRILKHFKQLGVFSSFRTSSDWSVRFCYSRQVVIMTVSYDFSGEDAVWPQFYCELIRGFWFKQRSFAGMVVRAIIKLGADLTYQTSTLFNALFIHLFLVQRNSSVRLQEISL